MITLLVAGEFSPAIVKASSMEEAAEAGMLDPTEEKMPVKVADNYEDVLGYARQDYNGTFCEKDPEAEEAIATYEGEQREAKKYEICALTASTNEVTLRKNGCFDFVDIIGELQSGGYVNLSDSAEYKVADTSVATCSRGRVYGVNVGTTEVIASYAGYEVSFWVTVQEFIDYDAMMQELIQGNGMDTYSLTTSQMNATMNRANEVAHVRWTTKKRFRMNDGKYAPEGTLMTGMPYTQREEGKCTVSNFVLNLDAADFYEEFEHERYQKESTYWARYGIDCSGFLCLSWNLPVLAASTLTFWNSIKNGGNYEKVGTYSIAPASGYDVSTERIDQSVLEEAYMSLTPGDAVVSRYLTRDADGDWVVAGHARLVTGVNKQTKEVYMLEARYNFPEPICVSFDDLAAEYYCPFAIKTSYYNSNNR